MAGWLASPFCGSGEGQVGRLLVRVSRSFLLHLPLFPPAPRTWFMTAGSPHLPNAWGQIWVGVGVAAETWERAALGMHGHVLRRPSRLLLCAGEDARGWRVGAGAVGGDGL